MKPRAFLSLLRIEILHSMQFRAAFWSRLFLSLFWTLVKASILVAFYTLGRSDASNISMRQAVSISWISQIVGFLVGGMGVDISLWNKISTGDIGLDLLRPFHLYAFMYGHLMANKLTRFLPYALPMLLIGLIVPGGYGMMPADSLMAAIAFAVSLVSGYLLSCACEMLSLGALMDLRFGSNISQILNISMQLLSGMFIPLQLFPESWQTFLRWQPFAGMMDLPARLYVGSAAVESLPAILCTQLLWASVAMFLGILWVNRSAKRMVLQGG